MTSPSANTPATQVAHPTRAVVRTVIAAVVGLIPLLPAISSALGPLQVPAILAVAAGVTRVLALPAVEEWLHDYVPWLSAQPPPPQQ